MRPPATKPGYRWLLALALSVAAAGGLVAASFTVLNPSSLVLSFTPPPVILHWVPGLYGAAPTAVIGANKTSFLISVAGSSYPDTVCNPYLNITASVVTPFGQYVYPLCWLPVGGTEYRDLFKKLIYIKSNAKWISEGYKDPGSLLLYNNTSLALPAGWSAVFAGGAFQAIRYPQDNLYNKTDIFEICLNNSVVLENASDNVSSTVNINIYILIAYFKYNRYEFNYLNGTIIAIYSGALNGWKKYNKKWICIETKINITDFENIDISNQHTFIIGFIPIIIIKNNLSKQYIYIKNVYISIDDIHHKIGLHHKGFYVTAPLVVLNTSRIAYPFWGCSLHAPLRRVPGLLGYGATDPYGFPLGEPPWRLSFDTDMILLNIYGSYYTENNVSVNIICSNGYVDTIYPITINILNKSNNVYHYEKMFLQALPWRDISSSERQIIANIVRMLALEASNLLYLFRVYGVVHLNG